MNEKNIIARALSVNIPLTNYEKRCIWNSNFVESRTSLSWTESRRASETELIPCIPQASENSVKFWKPSKYFQPIPEIVTKSSKILRI